VDPSLDAFDAELARRSLRKFIEMAWPVLLPGVAYQSNWHIDVICEHLEAASRGEIRRLIINIPPRTMKSLSVSVFWPAWTWLSRPETQWLFSSYGLDLALRDALQMRQVIQSVGLAASEGGLLERVGYQGLLRLLGQDWSLTDDQNRKGEFTNTLGGGRKSTSVTATVTGFGGDIIVADDPHNALEGHSEVKREEVLRWWNGAITSRMNQPKKSVRVVIMQRLHEEDLCGHILSKDLGYTHVCIPMEYEPKHPFVWPDDPRTEEGELLWPERFEAEELDQLKVDPYSYAGQYQQRPAPAEGGIFKRAWWQFYVEGQPPPAKRIWTSWDTALKDKTTGDYTVGMAWLQDLQNMYMLRMVRGHWSLVEALEQMKSMHAWITETHGRSGGACAHYVENAAMGPELIAAARRSVPGIVPVYGSIDKTQRAESVTPLLAGGNVWLPAHEHTMQPTAASSLIIEECAGFPNGAHDDIVDTLVYGIHPSRWTRGGAKRRRDDPGPMTGGLSPRDV
jgi:predicted phage terminase large subunit-like protein